MRLSALGLAVAGFLCAAAVASPPESAASPQAVNALNQRVTQHESEVAQLQQNVGQQESVNREAAERLQQQDRTIEALKRELKAAQVGSGKRRAGSR